jgi:hypothetical protein
VAPDLAVVNFSINAKAIDPSQAVTQVKQKTEQILEALESYEIVNVDTSKALVNKKSQANDEVVYYSSSMNCELTTSDIDRITDIQLTIVEMGAENLSSTRFVSTELKRHRKQARMEAMQAAMEKASYYCAAANIWRSHDKRQRGGEGDIRSGHRSFRSSGRVMCQGRPRGAHVQRPRGVLLIYPSLPIPHSATTRTEASRATGFRGCHVNTACLPDP